MLSTLQPRRPVFQSTTHKNSNHVATLNVPVGSSARVVLQPRSIEVCQAPSVLARVAATGRDDFLPRNQRGSIIRHDQAVVDQEYRRLRCRPWVSRQHFLEVVIPWVIAHCRDVLKRHHNTSPAKFLRWVTAHTLYADRRSGRGVIVRPQVMATLAQMDVRDVKHCLAAAREMGIYVRLLKGRKLDWPERCKARNEGSRQTGLSTVGAFVLPLGLLSGWNSATPPRGRSVLRSVSVRTSTSNRSANAKRRAQAPAPTKKVTRYVKPRGFGLAVALIQALHWLTTGPGGTSPGRIATQLTRFAIAPHPWTVPELLHAFTVINRRLSHSAPERAHHPAALLAWYLHQIDPIADHPDHVADLERDEARRRAGVERTARLRARVDADTERAQAAPVHRVGAAAAQIRADLARRHVSE